MWDVPDSSPNGKKEGIPSSMQQKVKFQHCNKVSNLFSERPGLCFLCLRSTKLWCPIFIITDYSQFLHEIRDKGIKKKKFYGEATHRSSLIAACCHLNLRSYQLKEAGCKGFFCLSSLLKEHEIYIYILLIISDYWYNDPLPIVQILFTLDPNGTISTWLRAGRYKCYQSRSSTSV